MSQLGTDHTIANFSAYDAIKEHWRVVIETPQGSQNKYAFDQELGLFVLTGILPEGMSFPYDFGFLPSTLGEDGDPLDVLLLMDEPAFCGCVVPSRLLGVIKAEQTERDGSRQRNDRLLAVPVKARTYNDSRSIEDLNDHRVNEIQQFFVSYNRINGKEFKPLGVSGAAEAEEIANNGIAAWRKKHKQRGRGGSNGATARAAQPSKTSKKRHRSGSKTRAS